jgi:hypothetical protein
MAIEDLDETNDAVDENNDAVNEQLDNMFGTDDAEPRSPSAPSNEQLYKRLALVRNFICI